MKYFLNREGSQNSGKMILNIKTGKKNCELKRSFVMYLKNPITIKKRQ